MGGDRDEYTDECSIHILLKCNPTSPSVVLVAAREVGADGQSFSRALSPVVLMSSADPQYGTNSTEERRYNPTLNTMHRFIASLPRRLLSTVYPPAEVMFVVHALEGEKFTLFRSPRF